MTHVHRLACGSLVLAALTLAAGVAQGNGPGCARALQLEAQGLTVDEIAHSMGITVAAVQSLCVSPQSVVVPAGRAPVGAAGPAPFGAAGPAPLGAAGPAPIGAAGPAPIGAAGPAPIGAAGPAPIGGGTTSTIKR